MEDLTQKTENNDLTLDDESKVYLQETAKWGKFLAIVGYVGIALLVLLGLFMFFGGSFVELSKFSPTVASGLSFAVIGIVYIIMAVIYIFPTNYLYKYSVKMKEGLQLNNQTSVTASFRNLKSLFKFFGIFTIVMLSIYVLMIVGVIIVYLIAIP